MEKLLEREEHFGSALDLIAFGSLEWTFCTNITEAKGSWKMYIQPFQRQVEWNISASNIFSLSLWSAFETLNLIGACGSNFPTMIKRMLCGQNAIVHMCTLMSGSTNWACNAWMVAPRIAPMATDNADILHLMFQMQMMGTSVWKATLVANQKHRFSCAEAQWHEVATRFCRAGWVASKLTAWMRKIRSNAFQSNGFTGNEWKVDENGFFIYCWLCSNLDLFDSSTFNCQENIVYFRLWKMYLGAARFSS